MKASKRPKWSIPEGVRRIGSKRPWKSARSTASTGPTDPATAKIPPDGEGKREAGRTPQALFRGCLLLSLLTVLLVGARFLSSTPAGENPTPPATVERVVEVRGGGVRNGVLSYGKTPTVGTVLQDAGCYPPPVDPLTAAVSIQRDTALVVEKGPQGGLQVRQEPLSVRTLWILGRPIPVNRAAVEDLERIPGLGPTLAQRIVAYRRTRGEITHLDQLLEIPGIKEKSLQKIRKYLTP